MHIICRMRYGRCRHARRAAKLAAVAALPALVLSSVTAPAARADTSDPVNLPALRLRVGDGESCTGASATSARTQPWTRRALQLSRSWQLSRGAGVTVAVVDTGVGDVPALSGRVTAVGGAGRDCVGHGSFAAGLIAGAPAGAYRAVTGVAPGARILALRGTTERGVASADLTAQGIRTAVDKGADVVYVGQAVARDHDGALAEAVAHAVAKDVLVVAPAAPDVAPEGPDGKSDTHARAYWPAGIPQVLAVVDYGPDGGRPDGAPAALAPDLAAPGDAVVGVGPTGEGHYLGSGSSLAAAHVAGAAALIRSYHPGLSAAEVSRRLVRAAYPDATPRLDTYAGLTAVLTGGATKPAPGPAHIPAAAPGEPRVRALLIAGGGVAVALLVGAAMAVVPRGRARKWRPAR